MERDVQMMCLVESVAFELRLLISSIMRAVWPMDALEDFEIFEPLCFVHLLRTSFQKSV